MNLIEKAREFAREKHAQQLRNYTGEPYFVHLEEVAGIVQRAGLSETAIAAAWLHDVIEDHGVEFEELSREFGPKVACMVVVLTDTPAGPGLNRERRKALDRDRLSKASATSQGIKCADLISNTSTIVKHNPGFARKYLPEKRAILEVLTRAPAPLLEQAWASLHAAEAELAATTDANLHRAQAVQDLAAALCKAASGAIALHGNDPDNNAILAGGFCFAIDQIDKSIDPTFKKRVLAQLAEVEERGNS